MFLLSNICGCVPNLFLARGIFCSSTCNNNHYITLGLTPGATQVEIKKAYFELCKKYHPDKNEGSTESTKMFRKITEAYEILGNEKSRQLYDQKMFYGGPTMRQTVNRREDYNYEAERYFYERTKPRRRYPGKTQHYNFDAWVNAHYPGGKSDSYRTIRNNQRSWGNRESGPSFYGRIRLPIIAINVIGFILIGVLITAMPSLYIDTNYGIENEYQPHKSISRISTSVYQGSQSTDDESAEKIPQSDN